MAEQEIAKHTKNVVGLFGKSGHGRRHKLGEVALEIFTIVFAVSLSIWLHSLGEHRHEQEQVRSFLLGLRHDLASDIAALKELDNNYHQRDANFLYLSALDPKAVPDPKTFEYAYAVANSNAFFNGLTSRYQGFKSAGKLTTIENEALLEKILDLYENVADKIKRSERGWGERQTIYRAYIENGLDGADDIARHYQLLVAPKGKRLLRQHVASKQLYERFGEYMKLGGEIIKEIDHEYPEQTSHK